MDRIIKIIKTDFKSYITQYSLGKHTFEKMFKYRLTYIYL